MEFENLLKLVGDDPVFETALLLAGEVRPALIHQQLSRWTAGGRICQLRRGVYALRPPYQKTKPHPFVLANRLQRASYVSAQSALAFYGLIPETVHRIVSVTTGRSEHLVTPLGEFEFRHVRPELLSGYHMLDLGGPQALVASPEKALLDLAYLEPAAGTPAYLAGLRLQNLDRLDLDALRRQAERIGKPKLIRAAQALRALANAETGAYESL